MKKTLFSLLLLLSGYLSPAQNSRIFINPYFDGGFTPSYVSAGLKGAAVGSIVKPGVNAVYMFSRQFGIEAGISRSRYQYETEGSDSTQPHYGVVCKEVQTYTDIPLCLHVTPRGAGINRRCLFYMDAGISFSFLGSAKYQQRYVTGGNTEPGYTPQVDNRSDFNSFVLKYLTGCGFIYGVRHRIMFETGIQFSGFITPDRTGNPHLLQGNYDGNSPVNLPALALRIGFHIKLG